MVKIVDIRVREEEILDLIAETYIQESKPISSAYLCQKCKLCYSSATVRNIMLSLEKQGLLCHLHTSSGRVPTQNGFKHYVRRLQEREVVETVSSLLDFNSLATAGIEEVISYSLDTLVKASGYTSMIAVSGQKEKVFFRGMRLILEQPEFEDIERLRHIFYTLEVKMDELQSVLFSCVDADIQILIGDDIGFDEISDCSLVASGLKEKEVMFALALLGPMRMDYAKALSCLQSMTRQLKTVLEDFM